MKKLFLFVFFISLCSFFFARGKKEYVYNINRSGIFLQGYDVVAYFTENKSRKGKQHISEKWNEVIFRFSSQINKELFKTNPDRYLQQYGGYCAWAMAKGDIFKIDPGIFAIVDDKLYLNYNKSVKKKWQKNRENLIETANNYWQKYLTRLKQQ